MSVIDTLITNRTEGAHYNYSDVNRVSEAVTYLAGILTAAGYTTTLPETLPTNWARASHFYIEDADKISRALTIVKNQFGADNAGAFPATFGNLTFTGANQIEQFLLNVDRLLSAIKLEWNIRQCGATNTGGSLIP